MFNNLSNFQTPNNSFAFGSMNNQNQPTNFNSVFANNQNHSTFQSSSHESSSFHNSSSVFATQRYNNQSNISNNVFAARRNVNQTRNFDTELDNIIDQRTQNHSFNANRRRPNGRASAGPFTPNNNRNQPNQPFGYNSAGAALDDIVDQRTRNKSRDASLRQRSSSPFVSRKRNKLNQPLGYNSDGAALDEVVDQRTNNNPRDTNWRQLNNSRSSAGPFNPNLNRNHQPLGYNSDGAALDEIVDQRSRNKSRDTNWRQPNHSRGLDGPFAPNNNQLNQPFGYNSSGAALDEVVDQRTQNYSRDANLRQRSDSPFAPRNRNQLNQSFDYNSDGTALDKIIDQRTHNNTPDTNWRQPNNNSGLDAPFGASEQETKGVFSGAFEKKGKGVFSSAFEQKGKGVFSSTFDQKGKGVFSSTFEQKGKGVFSGAFGQKGKGAFSNTSEQTSATQSGALPRAFEQTSKNHLGYVSGTFSTQQKRKQPEIQSNELRAKVFKSSIQSDNDQLDNTPVVASLNRRLKPEEMNPIQANLPEADSSIRKQELEEKKSTQKHTKKVVTNMAAHRAQRFGDTDKTEMYQQYKKNRVRERQLAIANGLIPDPNIPVRLEDAIDFRGTCEGMCSEFEMLEREIQNNVDSLETDGAKNVEPHKMVKAYRRSAAGNEQQLPSDVRTPEALIMTLDYLIDEILAQYPLDKCHAFIRDRTRSIRQDFTVQNIRDLHAIQVHERVARFHILCLHEMCEYEESKFSAQQETEQLRKVLLSLMEFYDDLREEEEIETPNEAEFRAYYYITHMRDQDIARQAQTLPVNLFRDPYIQRALEFVAFAQRNNEIPETSSRRNKPENVEACQNFYSKFFDLIADKNTPYLMACLLECNFADVRKGALKAMNVSHMLKAGGVPAEDVRRVLKYDTLEQLLKEANLYGIIIDMSLDQPTLCFGQKHYKAKTPVFVEPLSNPSQTKSLSLVEPKRRGRSFQDIINNIDSSLCRSDNDVDSPLFKEEYDRDDYNYEQNDQQEQKTYVAPSDQKKQKQLLEEARLKADAAEALAANERQKLQALIEKKQKEAQMKKEIKEQLEKEQLLKAKLKQEEQERQLQKEKEAQLREERARQEKLLLQQENLKQVEILRERARSLRELSKVMDGIIDTVLDEEIRVAIIKMKQVRKYLAKEMSPKLKVARARIAKRNKEALSKQERRQFGQYIATHNPYSTILKQKLLNYRHEHSSPEEIESRVQLSIDFDELVSEDLDELSRSESEVHESVWVKQSFAENIFHRVYDRVIHENKTNPKEYKPEWQLFISTPEKSGTTFEWYKRKFDLDDDFCRKVERYQQFDIATRIVTPETEFGAKWALDVGAIVFDLPDPGLTNEEDRRLYWEECRKRLEDLTKKIQKYSSRKVPILFTYFGDQEDTKKTLEQIPEILDLGKNPIVKDYHFLIMNPKTIVVRIVDEINWLANSS